MNRYLLLALTLLFLGFSQLGFAQEAPKDDAAELAKKLANPISSLISVPLQNSTDFGIGENNGSRYTLNVQPVLPFKVSKNWNLIARWVQPIISQYNITGADTHQSGLGDAVVSAFLSPAVSKGGFTWGVGPAFLIPDGSDYFTSKKLGLGPTAVALHQSKGVTYGALINQIWSVTGDESRSDISQLFFQPFFNYNWKSGAGIGGNFELTQNWEANSTLLWFNPVISGVTSLGKQKVQLVIGPRFNLAAPAGSKADFGIRTVVIFLFPK